MALMTSKSGRVCMMARANGLDEADLRRLPTAMSSRAGAQATSATQRSFRPAGRNAGAKGAGRASGCGLDSGHAASANEAAHGILATGVEGWGTESRDGGGRSDAALEASP